MAGVAYGYRWFVAICCYLNANINKKYVLTLSVVTVISSVLLGQSRFITAVVRSRATGVLSIGS